MKAIVFRCYGSPDVLQFEDIEKPTPADDEVLVKVVAASVNPLDWHYMRGSPYLMRLGSGLGAPKSTSMGVDFSGTVEAVGKNVKRFKPGDEVLGGGSGAFAEYVTVSEDRALVLKPANITFAQAATVPIAAITALQALRDKGKIKPGHKVLINGASGGVIWRRGDWRMQHPKSGYGPINRRRPRLRLHQRGLHRKREAIRPDHRYGWQSLTVSEPACSKAGGYFRHSRRGKRKLAWASNGPDQGADIVTVRGTRVRHAAGGAASR